MTNSKCKSAKAVQPPSTPPLQSSSTTASPLLSPTSSLPGPSEEDFLSDLSESWLDVGSHSSVDGRSSVGPSVLGDVFSDTSSDSHDHDPDHETQSHWSASSDGGRDGDVEDSGAVILEPTPEESVSPSLTGYTDAEASTKLGSSIDTIHTSSDQIRLIFPDGASFTSSSGLLSGGFTPSASISLSTPMPQPDQAPRPRAGTTIEPTLSPITAVGRSSSRRSSSPVHTPKKTTRKVEDSWLRSSRLWAPPKEVEKDRIAESYDYHLLQSTDDIQQIEAVLSEHRNTQDLRMPTVEASTDQTKEDVNSSKSNLNIEQLEDQIFPLKSEVSVDLKENSIEQVEARNSIATDNVEALKTIAKAWSTKISYIALASLFSIALLRSFGSTFCIPFVPDSKDISEPKVVPTTISESLPRSASFWDHLPFASPATTASVAIDPSTSASVVQSDTRLIQQALSTLASIHDKLSSAAVKIPATEQSAIHSQPTSKIEPSGSRSSTSCCSLSVRNTNVALTIPPAVHPPDSRVSMARKFTQKLLGINKTEGVEKPNATEIQASTPNCTCSLSTVVQTEILERLTRISRPALAYAATTSRCLSNVLGLLINALEKDMNEIYHLSGNIVKTTIATSETAIHRAAKGAAVSREIVATALRKVQTQIYSFFTSHSPGSKDESLARASAMLDSLSEYVEDRLDVLSDTLEEQANNMQEKSMDSIYKAKKGLDRLIQEAKKMRGVEEEKVRSTDAEKDGPLPFTHMSSRPFMGRKERARYHRPRRGDKRKEKREEREGVDQELRGKKVNIITHPMPPMEKPSKGKRLLDMVHHGAMAFVL
ncbi:uncharacterized protein IL334_000888 [Kwoniella shivajii]|uniref:Uncharacterized protein n=1 Tax=Kwoniella shivajii TaxID=564305 RepID=A0ABZ1CQM9_9TREE|nr:hypothetical protein IL334_000888 [Kwoniella shivajii]